MIVGLTAALLVVLPALSAGLQRGEGTNAILRETPPLLSFASKGAYTHHGEPFTVFFIIDYVAPVGPPAFVTIQDVSASPIEQEGVSECLISPNGASVGGDPISQGEKPSFRLWPPTLNQATGTDLFPSGIVIEVSGTAATATGDEAYKRHACDVVVEALVSHGHETANKTLKALVTAFPLPLVTVALGSFVVTEDPPANEVTPGQLELPPLAIVGLEPTFAILVEATANFLETKDEFHDNDYITLSFQDTAWTDEFELGAATFGPNENQGYGASFLLYASGSRHLCSIARLWDHDPVAGADDEIAAGRTCIMISYSQASHDDVDIDPPECAYLVHEYLAGRVPSPDAHLACVLALGAGGPTTLAWGNRGAVAVPALVDGEPGYFVIPPPG